jgi:hypothetical protein
MWPTAKEQEMKPAGTFVAKDESADLEIRIGVYPWAIDSSSRSSPGDTTVGGYDLRADDGRAVYKIGKGRYKILDTGGVIILVSEDRDAP